MTPATPMGLLLAGVYMGMRTQGEEVVERYYAAFDAHRSDWKGLVTALSERCFRTRASPFVVGPR